ncbi:MAG: hypothetical protein AAFO74_09005 [Pseudomonadota bacterium]
MFDPKPSQRPRIHMICSSAIIALTVSACAPSASTSESGSEQTSADIRLEKLWTAEGFDKPEGAVAAPDGTYLISNIAGNATQKNGKGWIAQVSADGAFNDTPWAEDFNAPKGMVVKDGVLYVADIDELVVLDAISGEKRAKIGVPGAKFLNDVAVWQDKIVVSDSETSSVYVLEGNTAPVLLKTEDHAGLNGLLEAADGALLIGSMSTGSLLSYRQEEGIKVLASGLDKPDGIGLAPNGGYVVSSWPGEVFHIGADFQVTKMLDTRRDKVLQNDLTISGDLVVIPNLQPGTVTAWRLVLDEAS